MGNSQSNLCASVKNDVRFLLLGAYSVLPSFAVPLGGGRLAGAGFQVPLKAQAAIL